MKQSYFIKTANYLLLSFAFISVFAQKEIDFRINLKEGECFEVQSTISQESVSTDEKNKDSKAEFTMSIQYRVIKKTPDLYRINFMYTDYYAIVTGIKKFKIDPKTADKLNILDGSTQIAMMMNKPFSVDLSPKGEICSIKESQIITKEFKAKTKKLSPDLCEQVYLMVNSFAGHEVLVDNIKSWTSYIPISTVKIGDQWIVMKDSSVTRYTFVAETDSTYMIEGIGSNKKTTSNEIQKGMVLIMIQEEEFTIVVEIDKQTFLPKIITQKTEMILKNEIQNYPKFSKAPVQAHSTSTLKIRSCY